MVKRYKRKAIVLEGLVWTEENHREMFNFLEGYDPGKAMNSVGENFYLDFSRKSRSGFLIIKTLEGEHVASKGDVIMKGTLGDFWPVKPKAHELTYDEVDANE